jgi:hypothetical protein
MNRESTQWTFAGIGIFIVTVGLCGYLGFFQVKDQSSADRLLLPNAGPVWIDPHVAKITEFQSSARPRGYERLPEALEDPRVEERKRIDRGEMIDAIQMQNRWNVR